MRQRKLFIIGLLALALSLLTMLAAQADVPAPTDGPARPVVLTSPRLIVELDSPPLAVAYQDQVQAAAVNGRLDASAPAGQAYIAQLQAEQAAFMNELRAALPNVAISAYINELGASVEAAYQVVFNGISIDVGAQDREALRQRIAKMPGVKNVYLDRPYFTQLYTSTALINAPAAWNHPAIGGVANAGAGVKVASVDGGIHKDAPMFSGAGYTYPPGYGPNGLGLTSNNNGKIIASRAYFRPWDPPAPGDENPWPGQNSTPHGVHTASTAAGNLVNNATYAGLNLGAISGVAPRAYVMSYRVFYASVNGNESSYTTEMVAALEDMVKDGADVVQNSWGEGPISSGGDFDPIDRALINAAEAGVFVSMSTGNSGPGLGTSDHPSPDYINVAASTTSGTLASGRLSISAPEPVTDTHKNFPFGVAGFGSPLPIGDIVTYTFKTAASAAPTNVTGCAPYPADTFAGVAAVIRRGGCFFSDKFYNAQQAGAVFVVIYNNAGDGLINMACGSHCAPGEITVSGVFIGQSNGQKLVDWYNANGDASILEFNAIAFQVGNTPDVIINFSSRGPGVGNTLKPDIAAPGVNIVAQGYTPGVTGEARHLGYGQVSGTSMAGPHVAGAAAMLRDIYPTWSVADIKSALMSTAKYLEVYNQDGSPAQPLDMGAGRLDLGRAIDPGVILDPPSLSFGVVPTGTTKTIEVKVRNITNAAESYNLSTLYTGDSFTQTTPLPGFSVSPTSIALAPGETKSVQVTFNPAASAGYGDNQGYILLAGSSHHAHLPAWARVTYATPLADVLIIDNDFSDGFGFYDYLWYYTSTLQSLGYSYAVWNVDDYIGSPTTIPDATTLGAYKAIIHFTGDNFYPNGSFAVSTGLTQLDQDRIVEYLNSGGSVIAMGQDLASTLDAAERDPEVGLRNFYYVYRLGSNYIQDSVSGSANTAVTPSGLIVAASSAPRAFSNAVVDLTQPRKYVDSGALSGAQEAPTPVTTETRGNFSIFYDVDQNLLKFSVTVIPTPTTPITVTNAHIHYGAAGVPGPVVRGLTAGVSLPVYVTNTLILAGQITDLTPTEIARMLNNEFYINIHTSVNPGGEIRGQIEPLAEPNQAWVDEVDNIFHDASQDPTPDGTTSESNLGSMPFLRYAGSYNVFDGNVGLLHRDQPSLERPGVDYAGRSAYTSFGLEGVNSHNPSALTRADLLDMMLKWVWSEPATVIISNTTTANSGGFTTLKASLSAGAPVSYRWDFGDNSPILGPLTTTEVGHSYAICKVYTVRAEVTDANGNVAIGSLNVNVTQNCTEPTATETVPQPEVTQQRIFLPLINK